MTAALPGFTPGSAGADWIMVMVQGLLLHG